MYHDIQVYKKAKGRVRAHLLFYTFALVAYFIFTFFFLEVTPYSNPSFFKTFICLSLGQIVLFSLLFGLLAIGNKWMRWLYWLCIPIVFLLYIVPVKLALNDLGNYMLYAKYLFCMIIKTMLLIQIGLYLFRNKYCRTFYNKTLFVNGEEYELEMDVEEDEIEEDIQIQPQVEEKVDTSIIYTRPQVALRLGACVYASLVIFPAFCQIFNGLFMSMDMQSSFAAKEIFIHCIFSAFIWTIPVFYLYYDQSTSKKCIAACVAGEVAMFLWYLYHLKQFLDLQAYSVRVFVLFILLDLIRYFLIYHFVKPIFSQASE